MSEPSQGAPPGPPIAAPAPPTQIPWMGLLAVLLGTFISTLNTRLSNFGLADIRGAVHAGFDEGAWITTALTVGQMLIAPVAMWLGAVYGPRRALMAAATAFAFISFVEPFSPNLPTLLALQFAGGLSTGFFVPLTLGFVLRNTPPKAWAYGIALYALNLEVSLNVSASLEGWYVENLSWSWIFWQNVPLALGMALCLRFGVRPEPPVVNRPRVDLFGLLSGGFGLALIYAALDQGNRLDWANSGVIWALMSAGAVLLVGFLVHEAIIPNPAVNLKVVFAAPLPRLLVLVAFLRLTILSTAYAIPQFLGVVRGFRALQVGQTLLWVAVPQLVVCFMAGYLLRRIDPRLVASVGFLSICIACLLVAHGLTPDWSTDQFVPSQLLQAIGQSLALSGVIFFAILHLRPQDALTFGAALQVSRLMGGEVGQAFVATLVRVRGQIASNQLGQHVQVGDGAVIHRLQLYSAATAGAGGPGSPAARGAALLGRVVHSSAITQGIIDCFVVIAAMTAVTLIIIVTRRAAPAGTGLARMAICATGRRREMIHIRPARTLPAVLAILAGCAVGPSYRPPVTAAGAQAPLVSLTPAAETSDQPPDDWWRLYRDPLLDQLLQEAFTANDNLKIAEANLSAARTVLEAAKVGRYPQTVAEVGGVYGRDPVTEEILEIGGHRPQNLWIFDDILDVSYEVDLFGHVRRSIEASRADAEATAAARDSVKITVAAETTRAYAQICTLGEQIAVARHSLDVVSREADITVHGHDAGANSEFDVVRAQGLAAQVRAAIPPLEGQRRAALFQLADLLGRTPSNAPTSVEACVTPPRLSALIPVGDGAALLKRRPDVRQADRRVASATARIGVATADLYPRISLTGFYGGVASRVEDLSTNLGLAWGVGPSISWSFPNQAGPRARVRQAKANEAAALASFDAVVLQALKETEQSLATYGAELDRRQALAEAQDRAHKAFDLAHDQLTAGAITYLELLTSEQSLVAADASVAASDAVLVQDQIAVFKALGGGWRAPRPGQ